MKKLFIFAVGIAILLGSGVAHADWHRGRHHGGWHGGWRGPGWGYHPRPYRYYGQPPIFYAPPRYYPPPVYYPRPYYPPY